MPLYHYLPSHLHEKVRREGVLRPVDETDPDSTKDYKGRGKTTEHILRIAGILRPGEKYKNYGVYTTPLGPLDGLAPEAEVLSGTHFAVPHEDVPAGSVLAYRHPETLRRVRVPFTEQSVAKALSLWTDDKVRAEVSRVMEERKAGRKGLYFTRLPQVISFDRIPLKEKKAMAFHDLMASFADELADIARVETEKQAGLGGAIAQGLKMDMDLERGKQLNQKARDMHENTHRLYAGAPLKPVSKVRIGKPVF